MTEFIYRWKVLLLGPDSVGRCSYNKRASSASEEQLNEKPRKTSVSGGL